MGDSARVPLGGDQLDNDNEELIMGYGPLAAFFTSKGFKISKSSLQKIGMPSAGGGGPPIEGYWGNLPAYRPGRALDWARSRIKQTRRKADADDSPVKVAQKITPCESPSPSPPSEPTRSQPISATAPTR